MWEGLANLGVPTDSSNQNNDVLVCVAPKKNQQTIQFYSLYGELTSKAVNLSVSRGKRLKWNGVAIPDSDEWSLSPSGTGLGKVSQSLNFQSLARQQQLEIYRGTVANTVSTRRWKVSVMEKQVPVSLSLTMSKFLSGYTKSFHLGVESGALQDLKG